MKKSIWIFGIIFMFIMNSGVAQAELSPYFKVAEIKGTMKDVGKQVMEAITESGWDVIGEYHPAQKDDLAVICFTNNNLKNLSLQFKDRGALASVMRAGLMRHGDTVTISILNPEYVFLAYWGEQLNGQDQQIKEMSERIKNIFKPMGNLTPFGGFEEAEDLPHYHYMMMMPYFDDPVELNEFSSFEEGLKTIHKNLKAGVGHTVRVFEQTFDGKEIAVFGVGLWDKEDGEAYFLPVVGESHIANLPYEIILQGKEATMLHGKYRIALYWPELKMGTFMKISGTPGDIKDMMEAVCGAE